MRWTVRRAVPADAPTIIDYNCRLAEESEGKTLERAKITPGVHALLADPAKGVYFVAEGADRRVVGQVMLTYEWSDWRNGWIWWIQSVYVEASARRQGVFRALFDRVTAAAREQGDVVGLRLYVERENRAAQRTYFDLGLKQTDYYLLEKMPLENNTGGAGNQIA